jgi:hypothetical protein
LQDEQLSGGKGTFIVTNYKEYLSALKSLAKLSQHKKVVVSDTIPDAKELSIQCCVTKEGVFIGPLQHQIVRHPLLVNPAIAEGDKFCGVQIIATDQQTPQHQAIITAAQHIGEVLRQEGYRGIFGVDFLLDRAGQLFVLEVNPRITGATPLLSALYRGQEGVPFYLLHLLELGSYEYAITDKSADFQKTGSLLLLHSLSTDNIIIERMPSSGTYKIEQGLLVLISQNVQLQKINKEEFVLQEYMPPAMHIKPGGRLVTLLFKRPVIDTDTNKLYNDVSEIVKIVRQNIIVQAVD